MEVRMNALTPELFLDLYQSVGWEPPCIEQVRTALKNTIANFTCYDTRRFPANGLGQVKKQFRSQGVHSYFHT